MFEKYQERVITEQKELGAKIINLTSFLMTDDAMCMENDRHKLLQQQLFIMLEYNIVLQKRLLLFQK